MKYVIMEGVNKEQVYKLSKAMVEKCYEASRLMSVKSDFSRAFLVLGGFVGAIGNPEFCEKEDFTKCVQFFFVGSADNRKK
nr:MAG TPA: hypothetical protein [Caudoviricetes sp.]